MHPFKLKLALISSLILDFQSHLLVGIYSDALHMQLPTGLDYSARDLAPVGDEDFPNDRTAIIPQRRLRYIKRLAKWGCIPICEDIFACNSRHHIVIRMGVIVSSLDPAKDSKRGFQSA